jgi:hypothetical protein
MDCCAVRCIDCSVAMALRFETGFRELLQAPDTLDAFPGQTREPIHVAEFPENVPDTPSVISAAVGEA